MPGVRLELLGGFQLSDAAGTPLLLPARKARAVLACVALSRGRPQPRDKLATLCWPESNTEQARTSLRQALSALRRALGPEEGVLRCDTDSVALADTATIDVSEFEQAVEAGSGVDAGALERAALLYRGDLLEGFHAAAPAFDQWLAIERERLRGLANGALTRLMWHYEQSGHTDRAIACATRLLAFDALQEGVHRTLMRLYDHQGRQALALRQYRQCKEALHRELGVQPEAETQSLYQAILQMRREVADTADTADSPDALGEADGTDVTNGRSSVADAAGEMAARDRPLLPRGQTRTAAYDRTVWGAHAHEPGAAAHGAGDAVQPLACPDAGAAGPELRHAVVVLASLDEPMAQAAERDLERLYARLVQWRQAVAELAGRCGGRLADALGGRVTVVFGVPVAHGNDAERALHFAMRVHRLAWGTAGTGGAKEDTAEGAADSVADSASAAATPGDGAHRARVGLASGQVVAVAEPGGIVLAGTPVTVAMQAMERAQPGTTLVSNRIFLALPGRIDAACVAEIVLPEVRDPIRLWHVRRVLDVEEMLPQHAFVGRQAELSQLAGVADDCLRSHHGRVVVIRGEAGIGKSRLAERFIALAREHGMEAHRVLVLDFGVAAGSEPLRVLVRSLLSIPAQADAPVRAAALAGACAAGQIDRDDLAFANDMLDLPQPPALAGALAAMDSATRERGVQRVLAELVRQRASLRPLLVVVEDVHWADRAWLDCLARLAAVTRQSPLTLALTVRAEQDPLDGGWRAATGGASLTTIDLGPLSDAEARELAACHPHVDAALAHSCIARAEGNPLFLDQLLRGLGNAQGGSAPPSEADGGADTDAAAPVATAAPGPAATGAEPTGPGAEAPPRQPGRAGQEPDLPDSLQSIVLARLDRLPAPDRIALQAAATLGQRFAPAALRELIGDPAYPCDNLVRHAMVRPEGEDYLFMHALIREAIYASLLTSRRMALHRRAAAWYAQRDLALHAGHLDAAEDPGAAQAYEAAARSEAAHFRNGNALRLVDRALAIVADARAAQPLHCLRGELALDLGQTEVSLDAYRKAVALADGNAQRAGAWLGVAAALRLLDHYIDALDALAHAEEAAAALGEPELLARIASLRGNVQFPMGNMEQCLAAHRQALHHASAAGSLLGEARALGGLGDAFYQQGRMRTAGAHFARCVALAREQGFLRIEGSNLPMLGVVSLFDIDLEAAVSHCEAALHIARRIGDARIEIIALDVIASVARFRADWEAVAAYAGRALSIARRLGARRFEAELQARQGFALGMQGARAQGEHLLVEAMRLSRASGVRYSGPTVLGFLARISADPARRRRALQDGMAILAQGCVSHCHLDLYEAGIDVSLEAGCWEEAAGYVQALRAYIAPEPFAWASFLAERATAQVEAGRALEAAGATPRMPLRRADLRAALAALSEHARELGLEHARLSIAPFLARLG